MKPLAIGAATLTTALGAGNAVTLTALRAQCSGLAPVRFADLPLATWTGEVEGVDAVAARLGEMLGRAVTFVDEPTGDPAGDADLVVLQNVRFDPRETSKDDAQRGAFADRLAAHADAYVDDAFGAVHRKHASVYDVPLRCVSAAGYLIQAEVAALRERVLDFMDAEVYPVEREIMEGLDAEVGPGVPYH